MIHAAFSVQKVRPKACIEWIRFRLDDYGNAARLFKSNPCI